MLNEMKMKSEKQNEVPHNHLFVVLTQVTLAIATSGPPTTTSTRATNGRWSMHPTKCPMMHLFRAGVVHADRVCIRTCMHTLIHSYTHPHSLIHAYTHTCLRSRVHSFMHTLIHAYTYPRTRSCRQSSLLSLLTLSQSKITTHIRPHRLQRRRHAALHTSVHGRSAPPREANYRSKVKCILFYFVRLLWHTPNLTLTHTYPHAYINYIYILSSLAYILLSSITPFYTYIIHVFINSYLDIYVLFIYTRLALAAAHVAYHQQDVPYTGPVIRGCTVLGEGARCQPTDRNDPGEGGGRTHPSRRVYAHTTITSCTCRDVVK